jgi:SAM-dependent methyltransferase
MMTSFKDHFSTQAASYAAFRPRYPEALAQLIAERAPTRELVVECGCGNGQLSALLAGQFAQVIATDASAEQLAHAAQHPHIHYHLATAEALPVADASADAIVAAQSVHWFDLPKFYAEVRRIARPGALLALITYTSSEIEGATNEVFRRFYEEIIPPFWPPERQVVEDGYRSLPFPFPEEPAPALAMEADWDLAHMLGYVRTWSAIRALEKTGKFHIFEQFESDMRAAWGDPATIRRVRFPILMRLGRVTTAR